MSWNEWVYLLFGLGLGIGGSQFLGKSKQTKTTDSSSVSSPVNREVKPVDSHEILTLQQQLQQSEIAYQLAQKMCQFKAGFLTRTAHELRSPLNGLIGLHQLILSDLCDDPTEERTFVAQANQSALKLMELMDRVIDISRLEYGTSQLEIQPLDLAELLTEVYNSTHLIAANRNLRLQLFLPSTEVYILADPRWLRQVFINLLDICFTQMQEGKIIISTQQQDADAIQVWLDTQLPNHIWSEPVDLTQLEAKNFTFSSGMNLLLTQSLLDLMQCRLEIISISTSTDTENEPCTTRLQLTIPLVKLESETALEPIDN